MFVGLERTQTLIWIILQAAFDEALCLLADSVVFWGSGWEVYMVCLENCSGG
jgi:hypothetical protein